MTTDHTDLTREDRPRPATTNGTDAMKLEHKKILITGAGSSIGLELARDLAHANDVVIAGRTTAKPCPGRRAASPRLATRTVNWRMRARSAQKKLVGMHWSHTIGVANPSNIVRKVADRLIADRSGA